MNKREVFKKRLSALKNNAKDKYSNKQFVEKRLQSDGTVKIDVNLPQESELFDPMAPAGSGQLNPEIFRYLDDQAYFVPTEYDLTVNFVGRSLDSAQQNHIETALREHYNMQVYDKLDDVRNNRRLGIFLLVFGILALAAYFFVAKFANNVIFHEVISIVGTFAVWEAVDCWLINGHHAKTELHNALQMAMIRVVFTPSDERQDVGQQR